MAPTENQETLLIIHTKNTFRERSHDLGRNSEILESHYGNSRDLSSLIQDLQWIKQLQNGSLLTPSARLQSHEAEKTMSKQNIRKTGSNEPHRIDDSNKPSYRSRLQNY